MLGGHRLWLAVCGFYLICKGHASVCEYVRIPFPIAWSVFCQGITNIGSGQKNSTAEIGLQGLWQVVLWCYAGHTPRLLCMLGSVCHTPHHKRGVHATASF
jgi:hypothetical protein